MANRENPHQRWLERQVVQIRTYSGTEQEFDMQAHLILDLHLDSLEMLELVVAVEQYTQHPLEDKSWMAWCRLQDVLDYIDTSANKAIKSILS